MAILPNIGEDDVIKDCKRIAVLILDFQNEFASSGGKLHSSVKDVMEKTGIAENLPKFIAAARESGALIIHSPVVLPIGSKFKPGDWDPHSYGDLVGLFTEGTWNAEFAKEVNAEDGDIVLTNRCTFDAFKGTGLADILEENNVGSLFVGGFLSNVCVEESINTAADIEGLDVYSLTDGCAAKSEEEHFVATTGTFPLFSTPVTCFQAEKVVRDLASGKTLEATSVYGAPNNNSRRNRESMVRRNAAGERRQTYLHEARHSAYLKMSKENAQMTKKNRTSISTMLHYYPEKEEPDEVGFDPASPIFIMIGSQRSGSNWLRTMLSEREDLAGPHPPHILRDFFPILDKFGDLEDEENLAILVDHVCTFVENNQVAWLDKHGRKVKFDRERILDIAISTVDIMRMVHKDKDINQRYYLISIFDEIYNINAIACDKRTWICKSMVNEDLVHQVRYEALLKSNEDTMKGINDFMGKRKMGKVLRRGSVAILKAVEDMMSGATKGTGAKQAAVLSYQFQNLTRGESFRMQQFEKWRTQMSDEDILLIESVAHEMMTRLGYQPKIVGVTQESLVFTEEQVAEFKVLNEEGIKKMHADLAVENPEDLKRRLIQKAVLEHEAIVIKKDDMEDDDLDEEDEDDEDDKIKKMYPYKWPKGAAKVGYLSNEDVAKRLQVKEDLYFESGNYKFHYSVAMQRGYYPSDLDKPCQDAFLEGSFNGAQWLCVFDGHGPTGHDCAEYARDTIIENYEATEPLQEPLGKALLNVNSKLHENQLIDDSNSGTTALTVLIKDGKLLIANVGDCRCVVVSTDGGKLSAKALTNDQTPHREDERERIKKAGGLVMTSEQYDGEEPMHENWLNGDSPPRIWSPNRDQGKFPGCAFTRSIGDMNGENLGVTADAEFSKYTLSDNDQIIIIGSDGIFEFISDIESANIASIYGDPTEACRALIGESYKRWIKREERTDDITSICAFISKKDE